MQAPVLEIASKYHDEIASYTQRHLRKGSNYRQLPSVPIIGERIQTICTCWFELVTRVSLVKPEIFLACLSVKSHTLEADISENKMILTDAYGIILLTKIFTAEFGVIAVPVVRNVHSLFLETHKDTLLNSDIQKSLFNVAFYWTPKNTKLSYISIPPNSVSVKYSEEIGAYLRKNVSRVNSDDFIPLVSQRILSVCESWLEFVKEKTSGALFRKFEEDLYYDVEDLDPTSQEKMMRVKLFDEEGIALVAKIFNDMYKIKVKTHSPLLKNSLAHRLIQENYNNSLLNLLPLREIFAVTFSSCY